MKKKLILLFDLLCELLRNTLMFVAFILFFFTQISSYSYLRLCLGHPKRR